jgi:hypothetical protein
MSEQRGGERGPADAADIREGRRFPIGPVGWAGIAAAALGIAYFLLPAETAEQSTDRKPAPEARTEATPPVANRAEVVAPAALERPSDPANTATTSERAAAVEP